MRFWAKSRVVAEVEIGSLKSGSSEVLGGSQIEASQRSARFFILKGCQRLAGG